MDVVVNARSLHFIAIATIIITVDVVAATYFVHT